MDVEEVSLKVNHLKMSIERIFLFTFLQLVLTKFLSLEIKIFLGSWDGAVVRAFASHQCGPGSIPARCHVMWVEFVVSSRPCSEGFSRGSPVCLPPQKLTLQIPIRPG